MPQKRHYESDAQRQAAYRQRLAHARSTQLAARGLPPLPALPTVPGYARWNALVNQAQHCLHSVEQEMRSYYEERSEAWQGSERGQSFEERLQAVQALLEGIDELIELPLTS